MVINTQNLSLPICFTIFYSICVLEGIYICCIYHFSCVGEHLIGSLKVALVGNIYTTEFGKYCREELFCLDSWLLNICQLTTGDDKHEACRT